MSSRKRVVILGSTGSIGESALKVARDLRDRMEVVGLAAGRSAKALLAQAQEFKPKAVALYDTTELDSIRGQLPVGTKVYGGADGLIELATLAEADMVLVSIVGTAGLAPALAAIRANKELAVASKEILVMAGEEVTREAAKHNVPILPVDSEHNAIFQCLVGEPSRHIRRLILTASGGPFRQTPAADFVKVTPAQALKHPTWNMGRKITIDSATLFNKGLEMIEARWLFGVPMDQVDVIVHPQSIVHSLVEFVDGSRSSTPSPIPTGCRTGSSRSTSRSSARFTSSRPIRCAFPRCAWRARRVLKAARCRPCSTPPTRSPCPRSSRAKSSFPPSGKRSRRSCKPTKTWSIRISTRSSAPIPGPAPPRWRKSRAGRPSVLETNPPSPGLRRHPHGSPFLL
jgi:NAD(P)-dependent dehydrogenase (short-subunit alcohol dehydrogenase family)